MAARAHRPAVHWVIADSLVALAAAVAIAVVVARLMGPTEFGLASTAFLLSSLTEALIVMPFAEPLIQRRRLSMATVDAAHAAMVITGIAVFAVLCALAVPLARFYQSPSLAMLVVVQASTCLLLGYRGTAEAMLSRKLRFKALSLRSIVAKVASLVVAICLALYGAGAWSVVLSNVAFAVASTVMVMSITARRPRFRPDVAQTRGLLDFGAFSLLDGLLWSATPRLFSFLIGHYHGIAALGLLNVAFRINDAICALIAAVTSRIALPIFARAAEVQGRLQKAFDTGTKITVIISAPVFVGLCFAGPDVILLLLGDAWRPAGDALVAVSLFSLANFARLLVAPAVKAQGRPAWLIWLHAVGLLYVGVMTVATSRAALAHQLWVWSSFGVVYFVTSVVVLGRATGFSWHSQLAPLARPALAVAGLAAALAAASFALPPDPLQSLVRQVGLGVLVYAGLLFLLERRFLRSLLPPQRPAMPAGETP